MLKHTTMVVAGTVFGTAAILGGIATQWGRIQPQFKAPSPVAVVSLQTDAERRRQQLAFETAQLTAALDVATKKYANHVSVVVTDLKSGVSAGVNSNSQMVSASLYKLFVGWGIYQMVDQGRLALTSPTASGMSVGACMTVMITVSDNDCGFTLGNIVGWQALDTNLMSHGLTQTHLNNYGKGYALVGDKLTSAADIATFLQQLYDGKLLSRQSTDAYIALLKQDQLNTWLPSGLPPGTHIAHKTGALYDLVHDAGIVYAPSSDYLIVVMSHGWENADTQPPAVFADISRQIWNFFAN